MPKFKDFVLILYQSRNKYAAFDGTAGMESIRKDKHGLIMIKHKIILNDRIHLWC